MNALRLAMMLVVVTFLSPAVPSVASPSTERSPVKVRVKRPRKKTAAGETVMLKVKVKNRTKAEQSFSLELAYAAGGEVFATEDLDLGPKERVTLLVPCQVPENHVFRRLAVTARVGEAEDGAKVRVEPDPDAEWAAGRDLYLANCAGCHGAKGKGLRGESLSGWLEALRDGPGSMPTYPQLDRGQVQAMRSYVLDPGAGDDGSPTLPDADWLRGRDVFLANCAGCHGDTGADIRHEELEEWLEAVREGEDDMPPIPGLTAEDVKLARVYALDPDRVVVDPDPDPDPNPDPDPGPATPTYEASVKAILDASCVSCHGAGLALGGIRADTFAEAFANRAAIVDSVEKNRMPTGGPLSQASKDVLRAWLDAGAPEK